MTAFTPPPLSDTLAWLLGRPVSAEDGLRNLKATEAIAEAATSGRVVELA